MKAFKEYMMRYIKQHQDFTFNTHQIGWLLSTRFYFNKDGKLCNGATFTPLNRYEQKSVWEYLRKHHENILFQSCAIESRYVDVNHIRVNSIVYHTSSHLEAIKQYINEFKHALR